MIPSVICYAERKKRYSMQLCRAFADGANGQVVLSRNPSGEPALIHGQDVWQQRLMNQYENWWQADHGYFGRGQYHRITYRARWVDGRGEPDYRRLNRFRINLEHQKRGNKILVVLQSPQYYGLWHRQNETAVRTGLVQKLRRHTNRDVVVRKKPIYGHKEPSLEKQLADAFCVVSYSSGVMLEALARGIPVVCLDKTYPAFRLSTSIDQLEGAGRPDLSHVRELFGVLAKHQWTLDEMRSGKAWSDLRAQKI